MKKYLVSNSCRTILSDSRKTQNASTNWFLIYNIPELVYSYFRYSFCCRFTMIFNVLPVLRDKQLVICGCIYVI